MKSVSSFVGRSEGSMRSIHTNPSDRFSKIDTLLVERPVVGAGIGFPAPTQWSETVLNIYYELITEFVVEETSSLISSTTFFCLISLKLTTHSLFFKYHLSRVAKPSWLGGPFGPTRNSEKNTKSSYECAYALNTSMD